MLKIARNNSKRRSEAINQLIDIAVKKLDDGDNVWKLRDQRKLVLFFTLNYVLTGDAFRDIHKW